MLLVTGQDSVLSVREKELRHFTFFDTTPYTLEGLYFFSFFFPPELITLGKTRKGSYKKVTFTSWSFKPLVTADWFESHQKKGQKHSQCHDVRQHDVNSLVLDFTQSENLTSNERLPWFVLSVRCETKSPLKLTVLGS